ncbi:mitochondrial inner-membrane-bound regulator-domain-containing protein [Aspergillus ambiguus]|uniref:mitochondrial inner-membrane-bound regulator-domain-containing protein n=1 Tax=Aspergillus ambiguus TaxID=176160 RepID=UPI003CCD18EA
MIDVILVTRLDRHFYSRKIAGLGRYLSAVYYLFTAFWGSPDASNSTLVKQLVGVLLSMQAFVPKNRRPRFELVLRIIDLNNIPLVNGTAFVKWRLPASSAPEHHGHTDKAVIIDHRAYWNYEKSLQLRLTIDRNQSLHECEIHFEIIQEFESSSHGDSKNMLGRIKLNIPEYVDKSDDDEGIVRRYLMQDSKINGTLRIGIAIRQVEGDRNFTTPPLKSAMVFGGIAGVVSSEQGDPVDLGRLPSLSSQSTEVSDLQDMYRRTLAASWNSNSDDLPADKLIEELFSGRSNDSDTYNTDSEPRYKPRPKRRPRFRKEEHKRVPIGVTALGKPGEVVVVSNPRRRRPLPATSQQKTSEVIDKSALPFMLNELEDNEDILDPSAVNERIESFCAPYLPRTKLTLNDWDNLRTKLQLSFTTRQLSDYVSQFARDASVSPESRIKHGTVDTTEWKPGTSVFFETGPGSQGGVADRVATSQSLSGKQLISERILRDCWHLGIIDEIGQLDVRLPSASLTLLLYSKHFSFEELASLHNAKIDITNSLGLVRVTGRQNSCESICEIVYDAITRIREEEVVLFPDEAQSKDHNRVFSAEFLTWISKTYGVAFEQDSGCPEKIYYLVENKQDADNARRTLNLAIYETSSPQVPFGTYLPSSEAISVYNVDSDESLSWFNRQKTWFRWAVPSVQTAEAMAPDTPLFDKHQTRLSDEILKLLRQPSTQTDEGSAQIHESVTAAVGRCLFYRKPAFQQTDLTAPQLGKMSLPRAFATEIPRVTSFLRTLTPHLPEEPQRPHLIRLVPSALHAQVFPPLELEVAMQTTPDTLGSSGNELTMRNAKVVLSESKVDYLLPESGLDLRFSRKLTRDLSEESSLEDVHNALGGLFSASLSNNSEIPLPAFTQIALPNDILRQPDNAAHPTGYSTGEYMFLPVNDIRGTRIHRYDFKGQQLNYAFYESGPFNPLKTTDLFLNMDLAATGDTVQETAQRDFNSFYTAACSLAFDMDKVWRMM